MRHTFAKRQDQKILLRNPFVPQFGLVAKTKPLVISGVTHQHTPFSPQRFQYRPSFMDEGLANALALVFQPDRNGPEAIRQMNEIRAFTASFRLDAWVIYPCCTLPVSVPGCAGLPRRARILFFGRPEYFVNSKPACLTGGSRLQISTTPGNSQKPSLEEIGQTPCKSKTGAQAPVPMWQMAQLRKMLVSCGEWSPIRPGLTQRVPEMQVLARLDQRLRRSASEQPAR